MILADENITDLIIDLLRENNYEVFSVKESLRSINDESIAKLSLQPPRIILTEDKYFGYLAFDKKIGMTGCILLRYVFGNEKEITEILIQFLKNESLNSLMGKFVTITNEKIRVTNL
jgi:predicted nuclease of predicted toxin-antitoxin system